MVVCIGGEMGAIIRQFHNYKFNITFLFCSDDIFMFLIYVLKYYINLTRTFLYLLVLFQQKGD